MVAKQLNLIRLKLCEKCPYYSQKWGDRPVCSTLATLLATKYIPKVVEKVVIMSSGQVHVECKINNLLHWGLVISTVKLGYNEQLGTGHFCSL